MVKLRAASFREQFRKKDLSKLEFRKIRGYKFGKLDKLNPNHGWGLVKDDTSAVIRKLAYTDSVNVVYHPNPKDLKNLLDLERALDEVKDLWKSKYPDDVID